MKNGNAGSKSPFRVPATRAEFLRIFGERDDALVAEVLALRPTVPELEQVALMVAGQAEELGKRGQVPRGVVAEILEILSSVEDQGEDDSPRRP